MAATIKGVVKPVERVKSALGSVKPVLDSVDRKADRTLGTWQKKFGQRGGGMFGGLKSSIGGIGTAVAGAFAVSEVVSFGKEVTNTLAKFEKSEAVLTNLFGDGSVAKTVLKDITKFAAETPFQVDELTESYVKLANQGFAPNMRQMMQLSDLASSTGKDFDQLSEAILDAQTGEFERLKEFGIRSEKSGDKVAFTFKGVKKEVDFTADSIQQYLLGLGDLKGVQGASNSIMATTGGKLSNLTDKITALKLQIGQELKPVISEVLSFMSDWVVRLRDTVSWVSANREILGRWLSIIGKVTLGIAGIYTVAKLILGVRTIIVTTVAAFKFLKLAIFAARLGMMSFNLAASLNPLGIFIGTIAAVGVGLYALINNFDAVKGYLLNLGTFLWNNHPFKWMIDLIDRVFPGFKKSLGSIMDSVVGIFKKVWDWIYNNLIKPVSDWFGSLFDFKEIPLSVSPDFAEDDFYEKLNPKSKGGGSDAGAGSSGKSKNISLGLSSVKGGGGNVKHISIRIDKLVEEFNIHTSNIGMSKSQVKDEMAKVLLSVVNDVNYQ